MIKKIAFLFILFLVAPMLAQKQSILATQISLEKTEMDVFVGFDTMGNLYYTKNNVFFMKNGKEVWQYKNIAMGKITRIDFQNQLKIMLYYENFNTIILLDNQLNEKQKINFSENEIPLVVSASGIASQNRLWIYNSLNQQIGLFDFLKNTFRNSSPPFAGNLKHYESNFNTFRWIDDKMNLQVVDVFGKISTIGKVPDYDQVQIVSDQEIVFSKDGNLFYQDIKKDRVYPIENVEKSFKNFFYKDQILAIFTDQGIINYKITTP